MVSSTLEGISKKGLEGLSRPQREILLEGIERYGSIYIEFEESVVRMILYSSLKTNQVLNVYQSQQGNYQRRRISSNVLLSQDLCSRRTVCTIQTFGPDTWESRGLISGNIRIFWTPVLGIF